MILSAILAALAVPAVALWVRRARMEERLVRGMRDG
jgi:hypothetical protein